MISPLLQRDYELSAFPKFTTFPIVSVLVSYRRVQTTWLLKGDSKRQGEKQGNCSYYLGFLYRLIDTALPDLSGLLL